MSWVLLDGSSIVSIVQLEGPLGRRAEGERVGPGRRSASAASSAAVERSAEPR